MKKTNRAITISGTGLVITVSMIVSYPTLGIAKPFSSSEIASAEDNIDKIIVKLLNDTIDAAKAENNEPVELISHSHSILKVP